jgi:hypothetical protein
MQLRAKEGDDGTTNVRPSRLAKGLAPLDEVEM